MIVFLVRDYGPIINNDNVTDNINLLDVDGL